MTITVTIAKWEKFNARKDRANYTWLRLQNDFFHDQAVFNLTDQQRCLFLFLLCEASKKQVAEIKIAPEYVAALLKHAASDTRKNLIILESFGLVICSADLDGALPAAGGELPANIPATDVRTNITNETDGQHALPARGTSPLAASINLALTEYRQTLTHFQVQRGVGEREYNRIARAISRYGPEMVRSAIVGARRQPKDKNFDPAKYVSLDLYLRDDRIERYANLGSGKESADGIDWGKICQR